MSSTPIVLLIITELVLCIGLAGLIAGAVGDSWWKIEIQDRKTEQGLWRTCISLGSNKDCTRRTAILKFDDVYIHDSVERDVILLSLIVSAGFALFAVISSSTMFCCQHNSGGWKCGSILVAIFSMLSVIFGLGGVIYAEVKYEEVWNLFDHGWSVICAWIGAIMCIFTFILSIILACCVSPGAQRNSNNGPYYQNQYGHNPTGYDQQGYGLK